MIDYLIYFSQILYSVIQWWCLWKSGPPKSLLRGKESFVKENSSQCFEQSPWSRNVSASHMFLSMCRGVSSFCGTLPSYIRQFCSVCGITETYNATLIKVAYISVHWCAKRSFPQGRTLIFFFFFFFLEASRRLQGQNHRKFPGENNNS